MCVCVCIYIYVFFFFFLSHSVMFDSLWTHGLVACQVPLSVKFSRPPCWSGEPSLLQGIFPTQELNPGLLHCRRILYHLIHQGSRYEKIWQQQGKKEIKYGILIKWSESRSVVSALRPHGLYSPWNSPSQNTGVGSLSLLQEIFSTQGLNAGLLHCRQILDQLSHKVSPFS